VTIQIPTRLRDLLVGSPHEGPTLGLAESVGTILTDNQTPFFPAYTDHGKQHVEKVLHAAVRLIPSDVLAQGDLLTAEDACVLINATLLHDLAMHLREFGFTELVAADSPHQPRLWFSEDQPSRPADKPWHELWSDFQREARHFGTSEIEMLLGEHGSSVPMVAHSPKLDAAQWTIADRLLIGEFLRRHHARLAHEIAIFGFPGVSDENFPLASFPILTNCLPELAELIGVVARSHNEPLRRMCDYLEFLAPGNRRPFGALAHLHMGLLRVADYVQIEANRAPPLLMLLKNIQSPRSVEEWNKHGAVSAFAWDHEDPLAVYVTVSPRHGLRTHLALGELLADLQTEMDVSVAVLREIYSGHTNLSELSLSRQRVLSNIDLESLHAQLPYIPRRAALRSDKDLFRLVIRDLYGNRPAVAGRELVQNSVDAVRARASWQQKIGRVAADEDAHDIEGDVEVTVHVENDGRSHLSVVDKGIGMTPDMVVDYFLTAGASFGPTPAELEGMDVEELLKTMKAGRFGVGAFAGFLLGREMRVRTRHITAAKGVEFTARINEDLVQLDWCDAPIGTSITVGIDEDALRFLDPEGQERLLEPEGLLTQIAEFYRLVKPKVKFFLSSESGRTLIAPMADVPQPSNRLPDRWRRVKTSGMDAVLWRIPLRTRYSRDSLSTLFGGLVVHNGILLRDPGEMLFLQKAAYRWSDPSMRAMLRTPTLAIFDARQALGIALHRYGLIDQALPFERQLLTGIGSDIVAHGMIEGSRNHPLQDAELYIPVHSRTGWFPLLPALLPLYSDDTLLVMWKPEERRNGPRFDMPDTNVFSSSRGPVSWRAFPRRSAITMELLSTDEYDLDELQEWGHPLDVISNEALVWSRRLKASSHTTVVLREIPIPESSSYVTNEYAIPWRHTGPKHRSPGLFVSGAAAKDQKLEKRLVEAARKLHEVDLSTTIALTAYEGFASPGDLQAVLAEPWIRHIGGQLPRGRQQLDSKAAELETNRSVGPLLRSWRRLSEEEELD
jgi:hypothetical protein